MNRERFFNSVRDAKVKVGSRSYAMFPGSISTYQVERAEAVLDGLQNRGVSLPRAAYILGTAHHESDRFKTLTEYASGKAYEGRKDLGNTVKGDGVKFKGRGFVQITGRRNYTDWSKRLGVDLIARPDLAATVEHAVPILIDGMLLGTFTGKPLTSYIRGEEKDYINARRVVNGTDRAELIAAYARQYETALRDAGYIGQAPKPSPVPPAVPVEPVQPVPAPETAPKPVARPEPPVTGWAAFFAWLFGK